MIDKLHNIIDGLMVTIEYFGLPFCLIVATIIIPLIIVLIWDK